MVLTRIKIVMFTQVPGPETIEYEDDVDEEAQALGSESENI